MIKQCTGIYVCPVAPTTKLSLTGNNYWPVVVPSVFRQTYTLATVFPRLCLCLRDRANNTDIGRQVRIGLNIAKWDAY